MKRYILPIFLIMVLFVAMCVPATISVYAKSSKVNVDLPFEEEGTLKGADYRISVPEEWNGTLLVYAHGYSDVMLPPPVQIAPGSGPTSAEGLLLANGYALAGSAFSSSDWAIREGIENTKDLTNYFKRKVGKPEHVIVWGTSLGTGVSLTCIEKYPGIFDGAVSEGGPIAGLPMQADYGLAFCLAYDMVFDWPEERWGPLGDLRDDIDVMDVMGTIGAQWGNLANYAKWEFIRLVVDYPAEALWALPPWQFGMPWPFVSFWFFTTETAKLEQKANGPVMQNLDHVYSLTQDKINYLDPLLLPFEMDAASLLADMNDSTTIEASNPARNYLERYFEFSGKIKGPVITIHNILDPLCNVANTGVYRDTVEAAGKDNLLFQVYDESLGHCLFEPEQYLFTIEAMKDWLEGTDPSTKDWDSEDFLTSPPYEPPPWPF